LELEIDANNVALRRRTDTNAQWLFVEHVIENDLELELQGFGI